MTLFTHKLAAATAVAAAISLAATPAAAVELPRLAGQQAVKAGALDAENRRHRGYRGYRDRDDDIDAGDVLAGVLILGGIAAIASAAGKQRTEEPYPVRYPEAEDDEYYRSPSADGGRLESLGIGRAVDTCLAEVERGGERVDSVDAASRDDDGWRVSGELDSGADFWCTVDDDGRVSGIGGSGTAYGEPAADEPYDDGYYSRARARKAQAGGGVDGDLGDDGRYEVAQAQ